LSNFERAPSNCPFRCWHQFELPDHCTEIKQVSLMDTMPNKTTFRLPFEILTPLELPHTCTPVILGLLAFVLDHIALFIGCRTERKKEVASFLMSIRLVIKAWGAFIIRLWTPRVFFSLTFIILYCLQPFPPNCVSHRMRASRLCLSPTNTQSIWLGSHHLLTKNNFNISSVWVTETASYPEVVTDSRQGKVSEVNNYLLRQLRSVINGCQTSRSIKVFNL
jgi:hypothetical protein